MSQTDVLLGLLLDDPIAALADKYGLPSDVAADVVGLPDSQIADIAENVRQIANRRLGIVPAHYTSITTCANCGPVPIFPGVPDWVPGCTWCFVEPEMRPKP
jgi:hypothetical protein